MKKPLPETSEDASPLPLRFWSSFFKLFSDGLGGEIDEDPVGIWVRASHRHDEVPFTEKTIYEDYVTRIL